MTQKVIAVGASANDGTGDPLRTSFTKINDNFTELYTTVVDIAKTTVGTLANRPTATSVLRGHMYIVDGGNGVADIVQVCVKNSSDTYVWKTVTIS